MDLKEVIKARFREIEVYRSHSLYEEAMEKCRKLAKLIQQSDRIKSKQQLLVIVAQKLQSLDKESRRVKADAASVQMTTRELALVKKLFTFADQKDEDSAAWELASALLVFGQFDQALSEFQILVSRDSLRVDAAKNMLRCHIGLSSLDEAVRQYHQWLSSNQFSQRELENIRTFLQNILEKKGMKQPLPKPAEREGGIEAKTDQEAFIDIISIQIPEPFKSPEGHDAVFDVACQRGNLISVIIPEGSQTPVQKFKSGLKIDNVQFFSAAVVFSSACVVSAVNLILTGPQKGGYALVMQVLNE